MLTENKTILKITAGKVSEGFKAEIISENTIKNISWTVCDNAGALQTQGDSTNTTISAIFEAKAWSVEKPELYTFVATITYENGEIEEISDRFGFRYFETDEKYIYLNGFPFYMRAYIRGAAAHEHQNNCNLSEYEFYKKNIRMAKSYGFNTIRFHSVVPPEECFRAADEEGILIHIEMRKEHDDYNNLQEMLYGKNDFITDEALIEIINSLYNHPSFMVYCVGNEIREPGKKPRIKEISEIVKKNDPTRLFIDTCAHGEYDRDGIDFDVHHMGYFFPYGRNGNMFSDTDNLLGFGTVTGRQMVKEEENVKIRRGISFKRPLIAHEVCHYVSWRDYYALKEKFEKFNIPAPWWVDEEIKMLEAKGYKENFKEYLQITKDFQFRCWKTAIEGIRSSNLLAGFHMLQFADTDKYENSNGVVDCFDDPHGISTEEFKKFNADTVVLARLPKQIFSTEETVKVPILLSQYMINPPKSGEFSYKLEGNKVYSEGTLNNVETEKSGLYTICSLEVKLPALKKAEKLILSCKIDFEDGTKCENSWELWVFPETENEVSATLRMDADYVKKSFKITKNNNFIITDKLDDELFADLENGKNVMLIYRSDWTRHLLDKTQKAPKYAFRGVWERYKGVIWDRGTINGGFDDKELLNKYGFATDGQINFQYYNLIDDSDKINLDEFPVKVKSIVSGLDKANRDRFDATKFRLPELMYDRTMRHFSYVFEMKVGKGKLLVTGFNFTDMENPAVKTMFNALVNYCNSKDFAPEHEIELELLKTHLLYIVQSGPNKEGMMTQYWQLDAEPVESMQYWEESERYLREDN